VDVYRMGEAAELLGVSADTVRRWADAGRLSARRDENGHRVIPGPELAAFASSLAAAADERSEVSSARNRLRGIITAVTKDAVMAQVETDDTAAADAAADGAVADAAADGAVVVEPEHETAQTIPTVQTVQTVQASRGRS
jgi:excisionase family DNA binding protein